MAKPFKLHSGYGENGKKHYWFTLHGKNGKVIMTSETYKRRTTAKDSMFSVQNRCFEVFGSNEENYLTDLT